MIWCIKQIQFYEFTLFRITKVVQFWCSWISSIHKETDLNGTAHVKDHTLLKSLKSKQRCNWQCLQSVTGLLLEFSQASAVWLPWQLHSHASLLFCLAAFVTWLPPFLLVVMTSLGSFLTSTDNGIWQLASSAEPSLISTRNKTWKTIFARVTN